MNKLKIIIERTRGGQPALREVLQRNKFLVVCNEKGQRKSNNRRGNLVRINPKDLVIVAINCNTYYRISIYEILEILEDNHIYIREINKYKEGIWYDILPQQEEIEKAIIEAMNLINSKEC